MLFIYYEPLLPPKADPATEAIPLIAPVKAACCLFGLVIYLTDPFLFVLFDQTRIVFQPTLGFAFFFLQLS